MGNKSNRKEQNVVDKKTSDTEFATEVPQSKKARKRAARARKNNN
ncbi:hypothetical protein ACFQ3N_17395 [Virgibacillus byunsanensis]|uniref:YfhD family protein n=1 Tax=Virgibacillus byunsanensis TaxID=570945 RepID=A0ABW3LTD8_9BACI